MALTRDDVIRKVEDLYKFRDLYFEEHPISQAATKSSDVERKMNELLQLVDDNQQQLNNKAEYFMLKGKCLNVQSKYDPNVEEALSKAVKLDPKHVEAWNLLGECFWKKEDIESAKNCFSGALQHQKNKISLRNLSMILRQLGNSRDEKLKNISESVVKAKEALNMDISDGISWFILGNACLAQFFGGKQDESVMAQCLKAYAQAEKDPMSKNHPDLHFNRSMCYIYQSDFDSALNGFRKASDIDPVWDVPKEKVDSLEKYMRTVYKMAKSKCNMSGKNKLQKMMSSFNESDLGPYGGGKFTSQSGKSIDLQQKMFDELILGQNKNAVVCGKVLDGLTIDSSLPYTFFLVDQKSLCIPICLYNVSTGYGVKTGDTVSIPEPFLMSCSLTSNCDSGAPENISYNFIRVETPVILVVNGKKLGVDKQAPTVLRVTAQSE